MSILVREHRRALARAETELRDANVAAEKCREDFRAVSDRNRELVKSKEKAVRNVTRDADAHIAEVKKEAASQKLKMQEYATTLEQAMQKAEMEREKAVITAQSHLNATPNDWSAKVNRLLAGLETVDECRDVLESIHRKGEQHEEDARHWRDVATQQKSQKLQKVTELAAAVKQRDQAENRCKSTLLLHATLEKRIRELETELDDTKAENGNLRVRLGAAQAQVGMTKAKLSDMERQFRDLSGPAAIAAPPASVVRTAVAPPRRSAETLGTWEPYPPGLGLEENVGQVAQKSVKVAGNPFAVLGKRAGGAQTVSPSKRAKLTGSAFSLAPLPKPGASRQSKIQFGRRVG
ncbi:hypothetical protein HKX48_004773 [Thoreauomyces humboldtii]|nr:hypothetical protein HKX48_004773 [Thoreauomyces humboldtii]